MFHPASVDRIGEAVAICETCGVRAECLDYALRHEALGVWGGTSQRHRARMRRALGIVLEAIEFDPAELVPLPPESVLEAS